MLRPATPEALDRLRLAVADVDRELDTALLCLGVLPPVDLSEIRAWLSLPGIELHAGTNADGHRLIAVAIGRRTVAQIHHDGRVASSDQALLLKSA